MKPTLPLLLLLSIATLACSTTDDARSSIAGPSAVDSPATSPPTTPHVVELGSPQAQPQPAQLPFYARLERGFEPFHTDDWAVIAFYRQPSCIPPAFNLLDFLDAPAAFGCPQTVAGFQIFDEPLPALPVQVNLTAAGQVPMWFVAWAELQAATVDDVVTIGDLASMSSLVTGSATTFREILHPGRKVTQIASGELADGRRFQVEISSVAGDKTLRHVRIEFGS